MAVSKRNLTAAPAAGSRDLRQRVFACISKLSDRDTHSIAAAELEAIAVNLSPAAVPSFISCLHIPDAASVKSPVRTQCVRLLSLLSRHHRNSLSTSLPKMISAVLRRLRDPDSSVRSACVDAVTAMASHIAAAPFSAFLKPLSGALFTEQDPNSQIGSALCLAAAIDAAPDPEPSQLQKLVPKLVKLLKSNSFKAKPALLTLVGGVIGAGGSSSCTVMRNLIPCMMEFVSSEDWAARKAAAEAFLKLAEVERDLLSEFKPSCLKTFENRRYDKVKAVRDTMNQMVEAWKDIPDVTDEVSPPPQSQSSKENVIGGGFPFVDSETHHTKKKYDTANRFPSSNGSTARSRSVLQNTSNNNIDLRVSAKLDQDQPSDLKTKIAAPGTLFERVVFEDDQKKSSEEVVEIGKHGKNRSSSKPEIKRVLFSRNSDENLPKPAGFKSRSRVVPSHDDDLKTTAVVGNNNVDICRNEKGREDLSLIRKHLVQIENQQSSLLDLLQRFIGTSQNGMHALETRVHGLERAVDEISFDLSTGRMSNTRSPGTTCCMLPGADFLNSKFWRRTEGRHSSRGTQFVSGLRNITGRNGNLEMSKLENQRFQLRNGSGFIVNPLAEIRSNSIGASDISSTSVPKNSQTAAFRAAGT